MTTVEAAAPRRADIVCVERPDVDVGAAQMLLEYQDRCARSHTHTHTHTYVYSSAWPIAETDVPFSHHTADTQVFFSLPTLCQFLAGLANSDGDTVTDCG